MQAESLMNNVTTLTGQHISDNPHAFQYEKEFRITFADTNAEGNVSHYEYAKYFGIVRELFAMDLVPNFMEDAGHKYLLKTCSASYEYKRDFFFGDTMLVCLRVGGVTASGLTLEADFINPKTGVIHATGIQEIVYTDLRGIPRRIPGELMSLLKAVI
jgi:acyl-CoA thioesterase FadM